MVNPSISSHFNGKEDCETGSKSCMFRVESQDVLPLSRLLSSLYDSLGLLSFLASVGESGHSLPCFHSRKITSILLVHCQVKRAIKSEFLLWMESVADVLVPFGDRFSSQSPGWCFGWATQ